MSEIIITTKSELEEIIESKLRRLGLGNINVSPIVLEDRVNQKEAARILGISESTLISWKRKKLVPYEQLPGSSKVRYYLSQLRQVCQHNPELLQAARK